MQQTTADHLWHSPLLPARFWNKVEPGEDGCWEWTGCRAKTGYGRFKVGRDTFYTHRISYETLVGPIPDGLCLDHLCRNRACCNPAHLEPVTFGANTLRGVGFAAVNARKTHCQNGHPFDAKNTYYTASGARTCRPCFKLWLRRKRGSSLPHYE